MKAKLIDTEEIYVKVTPIGFTWYRPTYDERIEFVKDQCDDIVKEINRHIDGVGDASIEVEQKYTLEDDYNDYETDTLQQLCEEMAIQRDLLDINDRWEVSWIDNNNERHSSVEWELGELLYRIANNNVIKITGRLNKYQRNLVDMAILLNDNELNIEFHE